MSRRISARTSIRPPIRPTKAASNFQSLTPDPDSTVLNSGSAYSLNYTGRLLNGQVFDTTIADTAKVHGIYDPTRTYEPVQINWADKATDITMGESETAVKDGFKIAVREGQNGFLFRPGIRIFRYRGPDSGILSACI